MLVKFAGSFVHDLDTLADWIAADSPARAITFIDEILNVCREMIARYPESGRQRPELGPQIRSYVTHERTVIYSFDAARGVIIFRRLVGAQRISRARL